MCAALNDLCSTTSPQRKHLIVMVTGEQCVLVAVVNASFTVEFYYATTNANAIFSIVNIGISI